VGVRFVTAGAPLRQTRTGPAPAGDGWFVLNARDSRWRDDGRFGRYCTFEGKRRFPQVGFNISVLEPGQPIGPYHRERAQEGFLVLQGECTLIVEGQERPLRQWDHFHCPAGTEHAIVGAGDAPSIVVAVGARGRGRSGVVYVASELAACFGASVERETTNASEAYRPFFADLPRSRWVAYPDGALPDRLG
jgi:uncharacterized cupin superfamily protein